MSNLSERNYQIFLEQLQKQFLCCYPVQCIQWENFPKHLNWDQQNMLIDYTYKCQLNREMPIKLQYQLNFLKKLIAYLEQDCSEIHDSIYESFCEMQQKIVSQPSEKFAFKHYVLNEKVHFSLKESNSFVADGTTGLCSWQAALALTDYFLHHKAILSNRRILELGSGAGLCGLIIYKLCQPKHLLLTDGSLSCVKLIEENIKHNFLHIEESIDNKWLMNNHILECCLLDWKAINCVKEIKTLLPDILLAADVVYDSSVFDDLLHAIDYVFNLKQNKVKIFLAATVRNQATLNGFLNKLGNLRFQIDNAEVIPSEESFLYWDRSTPVRILVITR
uniref:FAM86 N-terminal domain-containing protein n=1 Tax=Glossina pallidipes TaxID=7398 RepID=A0A1A9ZJV9_GLOPL